MNLIDQYEAWKLFRIHCPELAQRGFLIYTPYTVANNPSTPTGLPEGYLHPYPEKNFLLGIVINDLEDEERVNGTCEFLVGIKESCHLELPSDIKIPRILFDITILDQKILFFYWKGNRHDSDTVRFINKCEADGHSDHLIYAYLITPENMQFCVDCVIQEQRNMEGGGSQRS